VTLLALCLLLSVTITTVTHADSNSTVRVQGLTLAPLRTELEIAPGTVESGQLTIYNTTNTDMNVTMSAEAFNVVNSQYDYSFDSTSPITKWVQFDPGDIILAAGKSKTINYSISVPLGASPGGNYISLFSTASIGGTNQGVNSSERVGSLVYITVSGDVTHMGHVLNFFTPWVTAGSSDWTATIQNAGTAHFASAYSLSVQTLWNKPVLESSSSSLILPGTIRLIEGTIVQPQVPGIYKLVFTASLGDVPSVTLVHYIIYMPAYGWVILIAIILFIINRAVRIVQRKRSKKQTT